MADIIGTNGNKTLVGNYEDGTINGKAGNDTITFPYNYYNGYYTVTNFGGVGKGTNPTAAVIAEVDTLIFQGDRLTARNLLLIQNSNNLEITFEGDEGEFNGIATSASTSSQRFIYNDITGGLFFDLDGSASGFTQVKFAQLSAGLSLTQNNFVVV